MVLPRFRGLRMVCLAAVLVAFTAIPSPVSAENLADDLPRLMSVGEIPGISVAVIQILSPGRMR